MTNQCILRADLGHLAVLRVSLCALVVSIATWSLPVQAQNLGDLLKKTLRDAATTATPLASGGPISRTDKELGALGSTIAVAESFMIFVEPDGESYGLGWNRHGALGQGIVEREGSTGATHYLVPRGPFNMPLKLRVPDVLSVAAHRGASFLVTRAGDVFVIGTGDSLTLGIGASGSVPIPTKIDGLPPIAKIVASDNKVIALARDGTLWVWGDIQGHMYAKSANEPKDRSRPARHKEVSGVKDFSLCFDPGTGFAILGNGQIHKLGVQNKKMLSPAPLDRFIGGSDQVCFARTTAGDIVAWGALGRMGNGSSQSGATLSALIIPELKGAKKIVRYSTDFYLALMENGTILGWGSSYTRVQPFNTDRFARPMPFPGGLRDIDANTFVFYAIDQDRSLIQFGKLLPSGPSAPTNKFAILRRDAWQENPNLPTASSDLNSQAR